MIDFDDTEIQKKEIFEIFAVWIATPRGKRNPPTQSAFEQDHGVHHDTIARWKKMPLFRRAVMDLIPANLLENAGTMTNVLQAQMLKANHPDAAIWRLYLEYVCGFSSKLKVDASITRTDPFADLTDEQLLEMQAKYKSIEEAASDAIEKRANSKDEGGSGDLPEESTE